MLSETLANGNWNLAFLVLFFPLAGLLFNLIAGKWLGEKVIGAVASLATGLSFVMALLMGTWLMQGGGEAVTVPLFDWFRAGSLHLGWTLRIDTLSVMMMLVVTGVGTLIHIYAIGYMHDDVRHQGDPGRFQRFFVFLNLFIFAMLILVSADSYLMMFVGWEGVGLCSYLLIGFWYEKGAEGTGNAKAAKKAFIVNRIGDFGLLLALFLLFGAFGTLNFDPIFKNAALASPAIILAATLLMLLGVAGKSAQLPLFVWLPDAMAGPTPVSALIHAATMVTAGVYLIARSAPLYELAPSAQLVATWLGAATALFAATIAIAQNDIKKVLAYSTISQLGFMVAAVGMGAMVAGLFHLVTHAFFKALLFLAAGSVIQGMERGLHEAAHHGGEYDEDVDPQDMRSMGGLRSRMGLTFWVYLIGALALAGIAPLAGFFSKDEILLDALHEQPGVFAVLLTAAFLTAFYMGRQVLLVFFGQPRSEAAAHATESPAVMTVPLVLLAAGSVLAGALNLPVEGLHWLTGWLEHSIAGAESLPFDWLVAVGSTLVALSGLAAAYFFYGKRQPLGRALADPLSSAGCWVYSAFQHKWWVDDIYRKWLVGPLRAMSEFLAATFDQQVIDGVPKLLGESVKDFAIWLSGLQNGLVRSYIMAVLGGLIFILAFLLFIMR
ncbi:MAG TPA: NADH-quinone oxidoreductase subunit L [Anaerolineaceae bacterium]|nr:NADH-quinone oxidoreductase subunit L [Anaerolineaceae bacterium]HPN50677.1 NADH-quinone oxidoreductase subunit L [Anaerolineaceae bacterium]